MKKSLNGMVYAVEEGKIYFPLSHFVSDVVVGKDVAFFERLIGRTVETTRMVHLNNGKYLEESKFIELIESIPNSLVQSHGHNKGDIISCGAVKEKYMKFIRSVVEKENVKNIDVKSEKNISINNNEIEMIYEKLKKFNFEKDKFFLDNLNNMIDERLQFKERFGKYLKKFTELKNILKDFN